MSSRLDWPSYWRAVKDHRAYFRGAEYPMGRVRSWAEAIRFCWPRYAIVGATESTPIEPSALPGGGTIGSPAGSSHDGEGRR